MPSKYRPRPPRPTKNDVITALIQALATYSGAGHYGVTVEEPISYASFVLLAMSGRDQELIDMCRRFSVANVPVLAQATATGNCSTNKDSDK